jgi:hypothetical protein
MRLLVPLLVVVLTALPAVQAQIDAFLAPGGVLQQFCTGPCDPE